MNLEEWYKKQFFGFGSSKCGNTQNTANKIQYVLFIIQTNKKTTAKLSYIWELAVMVKTDIIEIMTICLKSKKPL